MTLPNGRSASTTFDFFYFSPTITFFYPARFDIGESGTVTVHGSNFIPGLTVQFGSQSPTPSNVTPTSFDVFVAGTEPPGPVSVTVTLPNGNFATSPGGFVVSNGSPRVVFVTSRFYDGDLGGIAGADAKCNQRAQAAGLSGTFHAWLADSTQSPATRESKVGSPYERPDGVIVANDWADLTDTTLRATLDRDEHGFLVSGHAWSNVTALFAVQESANHCNDWTSNSRLLDGRHGLLGLITFQWTEFGTDDPCQIYKRLYCVEQ